MSTSILLKNAGGFEALRRAITERAAQFLVEDLIESENDDLPDPYLDIQRPEFIKDNASTQDIAVWEARERQFTLIHGRVQQLLEYMVQTIESTLYERVVIAYSMKRRTPTLLFRAVKKVLKPSFKLAETDLKAKLEKLERSSQTIDLDVWLNTWIQVEEMAKISKFTWADEIIDRFHAALSHRSIFLRHHLLHLYEQEELL